MRVLGIAVALSTVVLGASASVIDSALLGGEAILDALSAHDYGRGTHNPYLEIHTNHLDAESGTKRKLCVLHPKGGDEFDDENFKQAFKECGTDGVIKLPDANYTINSPLTTHLSHARLDVHGWISFSANISHWVANRVPFEFQNLALGWIITGDNYVLDGHGTGGIYGNGQVWYSWAKEEGNKYGRPMSFAISDSRNVVVRNWSVVQPQFWASIVIRSENVLYTNYYVNATQYDPDPAAKEHFLSWLQNTDGCDTYKSTNVTFDGMIYQGGDDCLAFKPNSTGITARNITCHGGTGIAFGSIGQYKTKLDFLEDIHLEDISILPSSQHLPKNGLYYKSWMGNEYGTPPNGGGGGHGYARNITVDGFRVENVHRPIFLQSDLTYLQKHKRDGHDTGTFSWSDVHMRNVTGTGARNRLVWLDCSKREPCRNFTFEGIDLRPSQKDQPQLNYVCNNVVLGGSDGLDACHPNDEKVETDEGGPDGP